ncbi:hypothetical protein DUNSADRAFT_15803 [Dunaliella salina]|uniref:Cyclin-D1-binding protein 1-like N-terminal domain-containing protein n=1 Tax=Dunaliella salina TaxID=3046 RepID=A0ABQ7H1H4_DUNSA|nr:hypothetical protein DUNSADRAFT_15803 [Dunaliella salina]|eukprot:KAF5840708.1 hypothetical protein DUNSADRAFT_15803 [Dunaliella salina]
MQSLVSDTARLLEEIPGTVGSLSQTLQDAVEPVATDAVQLAECLRTEAAKVGLMCGSAASPPSVAELQALLQSLQRNVTALCLSLHALTKDAGPSFQQDLGRMIQACATRNAELVRSVLRPADVPRAVANVWDTCSTVKGPLTNKSALFKRMGGCLKAINDTLREMAEIEQQPMESIQEEDSTSDVDNDEEVESGSHQRRQDCATNGHGPLCTDGLSHESREPSAAQHNRSSHAAQPDGSHAAQPHESNTAQGAEEEEEGGSSVCDYEAGPFSARDKDVAAAGRALMGVAGQTLKLLSRHLLLGSDNLVGAPVEAWENCVWHAQNLQSTIEDLGAAMYPPQELDEIEGLNEGLEISVQCIVCFLALI